MKDFIDFGINHPLIFLSLYFLVMAVGCVSLKIIIHVNK